MIKRNLDMASDIDTQSINSAEANEKLAVGL